MLKRRVMRRGWRRWWSRISVVVVRRLVARGWREEVRLKRGKRVDMLVGFGSF